MAARRHYSAKHELTATPLETEQFVMNRLITHTLYAQSLKKANIVLSNDSVTKQLDDIYDQVGGQEKLELFLKDNYGDEVGIPLFQQWLEEAATENAVQQELLSRVTLRHILVALPENPTDEQVEAAKTKAESIRADLVADPSKFSEIAQNRSEDVASRDSGGSFGVTGRGDESPVLSADFESTIFSLPVGEISQPVRTSYGWHLLIVDERAGSIDMSKKAFTEKITKEAHIHTLMNIEGN